MPSSSRPFSWCFSTLGCPELRFEEALALADRFGIPHIEVRSLEGRDDLPEYLPTRFASPAEFSRAAQPFAAKPLVLSTSLRLIDSETLPDLLPFLPWAGDVRWIRVFDGGEVGRKLTAEERQKCRRCLEWCAAQLKERGLSAQIIIETHDLLCDLDECRRVIDIVGDGINILWDSHHAWKKSPVPYLDAWKALRPWVRHVHVKDSTPDSWDDLPYRYVAPGRGQFNFGGLLDLLSADGFQGAVSLEWERRWHPTLAPLEPVLVDMAGQGWLKG